jgi:hypothetical protein
MSHLKVNPKMCSEEVNLSARILPECRNIKLGENKNLLNEALKQKMYYS